MIGLAAVLVVGERAAAKPRRDRFNDSPWGVATKLLPRQQ